MFIVSDSEITKNNFKKQHFSQNIFGFD